MSVSSTLIFYTILAIPEYLYSHISTHRVLGIETDNSFKEEYSSRERERKKNKKEMPVLDTRTN